MRVQEIENHTPQDHLREIQHKFPQVNLHVSCQDHGCVIDQLMVDPQSRNQGLGKQIMQHLVDWADQHNKILALTPSKQWASSIKRLMAFYKQWNFVPNQGVHKDFRFRETLIREPQINGVYKMLKEAWTPEDQQMVHKNPSIQDLKNLARHNKYHSARFVIYNDGTVVAGDSEHYTHHSMAPAMGAWMVRGYVQWMGGKDYLYRSMEVYSPKNMDHPLLRKWEQGGIGNGNPEVVEEKWSKKYKKSIDCNNPKGFSQRAHCAARRKRRAGGTTKSKSVRENQLPSITKASDILLDIDYYMNEGCGIFAVALGLNYSGSEVYIISNNNGESWGRSFPYEITHVFVKLPNQGTWDAKGQRTIAQMAKDFYLDQGQYSVKGPFGPTEFAGKFMISSDSKPLYGTKKDIQALQTQLKNWAEPTVDTVTSQGDHSQIRQQRIANENRLDTLVESMLSHLQTQGLTEAQAVAHIHERLDEDLRKWFKQKWVRFGPDGKIRGACARGSESEGKPKCLPQKKAWALGKKKRATAAQRKRRLDPNPEREGKAKNVATKESMNCPSCGGPIVREEELNEKQDACYYKVKSRYKVWPSAYASGALVQCRKKGAKNWGKGKNK